MAVSGPHRMEQENPQLVEFNFYLAVLSDEKLVVIRSWFCLVAIGANLGY